ncbi:MAG: ATP-dependent DNA helicase [Betaproteobacteria bacterium]|nr:ATP-dependent DNA helicase [Betaproteobacteria bacterium]
MTDPEFILGSNGPLAGVIPGYRPRQQQIEMAREVARAIHDNAVLVAEARTGTGKTFAYLVPAVLSGVKVIISTGTKTLQDQLFRRDLPTVRQALRVPVTVALLKGRANYVCPYHLERAMGEARLPSAEHAAHLRRIARFAKVTHSGDKSELAEVPEDSPAWSVATSTRDNCLGQQCPGFNDCFVMAARRQALEADVVVVNHHLFFADVVLRDEGVSELLPACNAVIFDEAHQLPETATAFLGESLSTGQLQELARDTRGEALTAAADFAPLNEATHVLEKTVRDLRLAVPEEGVRLARSRVEARAGFGDALDAVAQRMGEMGALLQTQAERSPGLEACRQRSLEMAARLERWRRPDDPERVRWVEVFTQSMALHATPLSVADLFRRQLESHPRAWIFTSATLAVGRDFGHFCHELGLEGARTAAWDSPFDYPNQALLYAPPRMPDPNSPGYAEAVAEAAWPVIHAAGGRTFVLCTSLRAMRSIHARLREHFDAEGFAAPLLLQGESSRSELLARFRALGNAVLVASQSFWEGVDVRGEALSLVVIDRLPFAPPDDPVLAARIEKLQKAGRNAFMEYQLPRAVISIKQGAGRLIRDATDRGVLMICDPRMLSRPYGRTVWRSLPPMRRSREPAEAVAFFAAAGGAG